VQLINQYSQYMQYAQMFGIQDPANDQNFGPTLNQISTELSTTDTLGQKVLDSIIDERLIRQETTKRGITVSKEDVDKLMQETFGYFPNGTPSPTVTATEPVLPTNNPTQLALVTITPTPSPFHTETPTATPTLDPLVTPTQTLAPTATATTEPTFTPGPTSTPEPTATPYTLEGYTTKYKEGFDGMSKQTGLNEADYRKLFEDTLLRQKLYEAITADLKPFNEQVWARHILVATEDEAKAIVASLNTGADFAALAAEKSLDTSSGAKGGDLGWFARGAMAAPFEEAAFALKVGEISAPVQSDFGYHVIQVLGHEERPLDAAQFQTYKDKVFSDFLKKLRDEGKVETYDLWKTIVPTTPALSGQ
jgi:peptidyl-prolyl cis-trans isomerase D